jgi:hypothetical protein
MDNTKDPLDVKSVLSFLEDGREQGLAFSTLRARLNAISTTLPLSPEGLTIGQLPLVDKFMKGLEATCPKNPPNRAMWDLKEALTNFAGWKEEDPQSLACKAAFILAIATMWRPRSDLSRLVRSQVIFDKEGVSLLVQSPKEGDWKSTFLPRNSLASILCPVSLLKKYLSYSDTFRSADTPDRVFLVMHGNQASAATPDTIARWVRQAMDKCGVDISKFTPHSTRSTSTSSAFRSGSMSLDQILQAANWSNATTFMKFYRRDYIAADLRPPLHPCPRSNTKLAILEAAGAAIEGNPSISEGTETNLEDSREAATAASEVSHRPPP